MTMPKIMGIVNITPDSFSDGGQYGSEVSVCAQVEILVLSGADVIDIGGESTRPFAEPVSVQEELDRVIPAIRSIRKKFSIPISIDTSKAEVARQALAAGADIINDISALRKDPGMILLVQKTTVPIIIMHMQGTPGDMQMKPQYDDVVAEICDFFEERLNWLDKNNVQRSRITLDPGIGFGKSLSHNLSILKHLSVFKQFGCPVLLGHSRKRFIEDISSLPVGERDLPTAVLSALACSSGVDMLRIHDVSSTRTALQMVEAVSTAS